MSDDGGQIGIDFLLGISIFMLTLAFMVQFIPGLFASSSSGGSSLSSVAYRTASILVEDPGWWSNNTHNGTNWENHTENIRRLGLARDTTTSTRLTDEVNFLARLKILSMMELDREEITTRLGLYDNVSGAHVEYGYNITITENSAPLLLNGTRATFGETPPVAADIYKVTRVVLVETGSVACFDADELTASSSNIAKINVSGLQSDNVTIQITDFNVTGTSPEFKNATLDGVNITSSNYAAYKRTNTSEFVDATVPISLNSTDTLRLSFNYTLFPAPTTYTLGLEFVNISFTPVPPPYTNYSENVEPLYEPARLTVEVWR